MLFENKKHGLYTLDKHKIALNRDDAKNIQIDGTMTVTKGYLA